MNKAMTEMGSGQGSWVFVYNSHFYIAISWFGFLSLRVLLSIRTREVRQAGCLFTTCIY